MWKFENVGNVKNVEMWTMGRMWKWEDCGNGKIVGLNNVCMLVVWFWLSCIRYLESRNLHPASCIPYPVSRIPYPVSRIPYPAISHPK